MHADLGKAWELLGDYGKAAEEYEKSLRLNPEHNRLHLLLGRLYRKLGKPELAQKHTDTFKKLEAQKQSESLERSEAVRKQ